MKNAKPPKQNEPQINLKGVVNLNQKDNQYPILASVCCEFLQKLNVFIRGESGKRKNKDRKSIITGFNSSTWEVKCNQIS
jgi:hypothetical protein